MDLKQYGRCCAWLDQIRAAQDIAEYSRDAALTLLSAVANSMLFWRQGSEHPVFMAVAEGVLEAFYEIHWECPELRPQIAAACVAMWATQPPVASTSAALEPTTPVALEPTIHAPSSSPLELELPPQPAPSAHPEPAPPASASASPVVDILVPSSAVAIPTFSEKIVPFSDDVISHASPIIMGGGHHVGSMIGDLGLAALAFIPILTVIILRAHTTAALIGPMQCPLMPFISAPPVCFDPGG